MQDHIAEIDQQPAILWGALDATFHLVLLANSLDCGVSQRADHTVAGTGRNNKIIRKIRNIVDIQQEDVFSLPVFENIDNTAG